MKEQLTINELAPYLSYSLTGIWIPPFKKTGKIYRLSSVTTAGSVFLIRSTKTTVTADARPIYEFKPLVIPLDKLIPELAEWLTLEKTAHVLGNRITLITKEVATEYLTIKLRCIEMLPLFIAQEIYKRHGDLHGLIPRNIAIDKTLNS